MRNYITINISQAEIDYSQVIETSIDTIRKSLDGTEFLAKWEGDTPETISNVPDSDKSEIMNSVQAYALMRTPEWSSPIE